jgi:hypothetical protein
MGMTVHASCACGFQARDLPVGGGAASFRVYCAFPVYCRKCNTMTTANLLGKPATCGKCQGTNIVPYDDAALLREPGSREVARWNVQQILGRDLALFDGHYYCPSCRNFTLCFESGAMWD